MSIRWREDGTLICGAKSQERPHDCYIDDRLHYHLSVELGIVIPDENEKENGLWHWITGREIAKNDYQRYCDDDTFNGSYEDWLNEVT